MTLQRLATVAFSGFVMYLLLIAAIVAGFVEMSEKLFLFTSPFLLVLAVLITKVIRREMKSQKKQPRERWQ